MNRSLLVLTTVAAVLTLSVSCQAKKQQEKMPACDNVVNMSVISKMGLADETVKSVEALYQSKQDEMKSMMEELKPSSDSKPSCEEMEAARERMTLFKAQYRAELKKILGDQYVTYLEMYIDAQPAMPQGGGDMGGGRQQGGPGGGMGGPNGGMGGPGGGMGGPGGGMGW